VFGLAFDGQNLWISYENLFKVDPKTGTVITSFSAPNYEESIAITFDGEFLWVHTESDYIKDEKTGIEMMYHSAHKVYIDHTGPTTSLVSPDEGATVAGSPQMAFEINDPAGVANVELRIEGIHPTWIDITANYDTEHARYDFPWDTTEAADGEVAIALRTTDTLRNVATTTYHLTIDNTGPILSFVSPKEGGSVQGMVQLAVRAEDASPIAWVELQIEGTPEGWLNITANYDPTEDYYYYEWNTTKTVNGPYTIITRARDSIGNKGTGTLHLIVDNPDVVPPTVEFLSPEEDTTVSGTVRIKVKATDDRGITMVELKLEDDWVDISSNYNSTGSFYYYDWDTTQVNDGAYTLTVLATDTSNNQVLNDLHLNVENPLIPGFTPLEVLVALACLTVMVRKKLKR